MLFYSWTNPRFMSLTVPYFGTMQIDSQNTGPFSVLCLLSEIFDSTRLDFFFFIKEQYTKIL